MLNLRKKNGGRTTGGTGHLSSFSGEKNSRFHYRYLTEDFEFFWKKLLAGENFALMRCADGEYALMRGKPVVAQEGWRSPDRISALGHAIYDSLQIDDPRLFYAISCPYCDREAYYWYRTHTAGHNFTFSNLWVNKNYPEFRKRFPALKRDAVLIANYRAAGKKIGNLNILRHYEISDDCISFWEQEAPRLLAQIKQDFGNRKNLLYVVSAGPMSNPIIASLFRNDPDNCYLDFGSSLDPFYREVRTRPYMIPGNVYAERDCFMEDDPLFRLDTSVVLTLYKRPGALARQLEAIEKQTLKPREILLFQDKTADGTCVTIPEELKKRFDLVEVSRENQGVWGRFRFAMEKASSSFVCVFDDDTIPGPRWLENCHAEMMKQRGLYGAVGIILQNTEDYPSKGYYRVGWPPDGHLSRTAEVDFVGHSWFFRKEDLPCLFEAPEPVRQLKRAGEDMSFSRQLQKKGIRTFVPPHPDDDPALYGSADGDVFGKDQAAVSLDPENLAVMNRAYRILIADGWQILCRKHLLRIFLLKVYLRVTLNPVLKKCRHAGYEFLRMVWHGWKKIGNMGKNT